MRRTASGSNSRSSRVLAVSAVWSVREKTILSAAFQIAATSWITGGPNDRAPWYTAWVTMYVALLRGINVGGKNLIRMPALKACFEEHGFGDVATYIQSGNVLFTSPAARPAELAHRIEEMLAATFDYVPTVVVRSRAQMRAVVDKAPKGFGTKPATYRYNVVFLKEPLTARRAMANIDTHPEIDEAHPGTGVLYFSNLKARATASRLNRIASSPIYPSVTIRYWSTTTKLLQLMG
jgi:uncharacterized protein (DUF1697 family)